MSRFNSVKYTKSAGRVPFNAIIHVHLVMSHLMQLFMSTCLLVYTQALTNQNAAFDI